jgi:hypothetical protein
LRLTADLARRGQVWLFVSLRLGGARPEFGCIPLPCAVLELLQSGCAAGQPEPATSSPRRVETLNKSN